MFFNRFFTSIFLIILLISIIFYLPNVCFWLSSLILCLLAQSEFYEMFRKKGLHPFKKYGLFAGFVIITIQYLIFQHSWLAQFKESLLLIMVIIMIGLIVRVLFQFEHVQPLANMATTVAGVIYIPWLFCFLIKIRFLYDVHGKWYILMLFCISKFTDIMAYVSGSLLGRHKLAPMISAKKTIEGSIGGLCGAILAGILLKLSFAGVYQVFSWSQLLILTIVLGVFGQVGDLFESALKRDAGIKDSGQLFPGMGGALDVIDSLLVVSPMMYLMLVFFNIR